MAEAAQTTWGRRGRNEVKLIPIERIQFNFTITFAGCERSIVDDCLENIADRWS